MPIFDYNKSRTWDGLYRTHIALGEWSTHPLFGQTVGYGRTYANLMQAPWGDITWHRNYWSALTSAIAIPTDATIAFIGGSYGFLAEAAIAAGWPNCQVVDDSNHIDAHKNDLAWRSPDGGTTWVEDTPNAVRPILKNTLDNPAQLRNALGGRQDFVITEFLLQDLFSPLDPLFDASTESDELTQALTNCDGVAVSGTGTVLHLVSTDRNARPPYHVKSLADWKAIRPAHRFAPASLTDFEVL